MSSPSPSSPESPAAGAFGEAKRMAARLHRPVYVVDGQLSTAKPARPAATVWPNGTVTVGNADAAARDIERRLRPPAA